MKVEPTLIVIKGKSASGKPSGRSSGKASKSRPEVISMISLENQEASRLDPHSLQEAQGLLEQLLFQVEQDKGETVGEVHRLKDRCLVRLW
jgi:hypothetical protein